MLQSTFLHIPGIGYKTERMLWEQEIYSWDDFLEKRRKVTLIEGKASRIERWLKASEKALERRDVLFFAKNLPQTELWRLYPDFKDSLVFLDLETTGLSFFYDDITVIGIFDGTKVETFIQGQNLHKFKAEIKKYSILVTYNGALFDARFIREKIGPKYIPPVHIDLRFLLKRLGYTGGLKSVEEQLGIARKQEISDISGFEASVLWNRYVRGDDKALELLVKYNLADIVNLKILLEFAYYRLYKSLLGNYRSCELEADVPIMDVTMQRRSGSVLELRIGSTKSILVRTQRNRTPVVTIDDLLLKLGKSQRRVVGIDLSASDKRKTGWALLEGRHAETMLLRTDREIIETTTRSHPSLISIDSPLSLPKGRDCTKDNCECRRFGITREAERILRSRGVYVFPSLIRSMQQLTERGISLRNEFERRGYSVIESYPGAAQDILRIIRKKVSLEDLRKGLENVGLSVSFTRGKYSHDELDAVTSALVGYFYLAGEYEALGNKEEGFLIIPRIHIRPV